MIKQPLDEAEVLKPKDPTLQDEDDWEEFTLSSVEVFDADGEELTGLIAAEEGKPLMVVGKLDRLPQHLQQYRTLNHLDVSFERKANRIGSIRQTCPSGCHSSH